MRDGRNVRPSAFGVFRPSCNPRLREARHREADQLSEQASEFLAVDDPVKESVLQEELAGLETWRELNPNGLRDHLGAGEADQRFRLGDDEVAQ